MASQGSSSFEVHVAHWNVRSMKSRDRAKYSEPKVTDLVNHLEKNRIDILGISETHIQAVGLKSHLIGEQFVLLISNLPPVPAPEETIKTEKLIHNMKNRRPGVGLLVRKSLFNKSRRVNSPDPTRVLGILITAPNGLKVLVIEAYSPTDKTTSRSGIKMAELRECKVKTKEKFYCDLQTMMDENRRKVDDIVLMGDFNGRTGWGREWSSVIGDYPEVVDPRRKSKLPSMPSDNGLRLLCFCHNNGLIIVNNTFERPNDDKWTWQHPNQTANRIDFIIASRNSTIMEFHINSGKNIGRVNSDHRLIRAKFQLSKTSASAVTDLTDSFQSFSLSAHGAAAGTSSRKLTNSHDERKREFESYQKTSIPSETDDVNMPASDDDD